jgi:hypothetical protein
VSAEVLDQKEKKMSECEEREVGYDMKNPIKTLKGKMGAN